MTRILPACALAALLIAGCRSAGPPVFPRGGDLPEAISLLDRPLRAPELDPEREAALQADLDAAARIYADQPTDEEAIIWLGRRAAYLGRYREAIAIFSEGLRFNPNSVGLLRHRGHRFITTRQLDRAAHDLRRASRLLVGEPDAVEPDGVPNALGIPRSTLHGNVWYHLALVRYLQGDFDAAAEAWGEAIEVAGNDDSLVAAACWRWLALRRARRDAEAARLLERIDLTMEVLENHAYHRLLLLFAGRLDLDDLVAADDATAIDDATLAHGIAAWHLVAGREAEAIALMERIVAGDAWPAFGFIAAEAELARRLDR